MRHVNLVQLYEDNREKLLLNWHVGQNADRRIEIKGSNSYGADLVGHINIIHPERLQVLGMAEYDWAMRIGERRFGQMFSDLLNAQRCNAVLAQLLEAGSLNKSGYAQLCALSPATASKHLVTLAERGLLVQSGKGPATRYTLPA